MTTWKVILPGSARAVLPGRGPRMIRHGRGMRSTLLFKQEQPDTRPATGIDHPLIEILGRHFDL